MTVRNPYSTKPKKPRNPKLHYWFTHQKRLEKHKMARRTWSPSTFNKKVLRNKRRRPKYQRYQKRVTRRPTTKTIRNKIMNKNYLGYMNPFLTTHVSRIPDAGVTHSMPVQHRVIDEIVPPVPDTPGAPTTQPTTHIFIYPGLEGGCVFINDDELFAANEPYADDADQTQINKGRLPAGHDMAYGQNEHHPGNTMYMDVNTYIENDDQETPQAQLKFQHCPDPTLPGNTRQRLQINSGISKFRVTSQALKLTLLNTDQENDGWWEAVRIPYQPQMDHWRLNMPNFFWDEDAGGMPETGSKVVRAHTSKTSLEPSIELFNEYQGKNIAQQNSYESGSLKFLSSRYFTLGHQSPNTDFQHLEQNYKLEVLPSLEYKTEFPNGVTLPGGYPSDGELFKGAVKLDKGAPAAKQLFRSMYDTCMDMLYIRIHPGSQGSRVLAELLCNHEVVYGADTALSKYQLATPRKSSSLYSWQRDRQKQSEKASNPVSPIMSGH